MAEQSIVSPRKTFFVDAELCTGCRLCELVCSLSKEGKCDPSRARIHIERHMFDGLMIPRICRNCKDPPCVKACKRGALILDTETGWVTLNYNRCNNCTLCISACPFQAFTITPEREVLLCDLCGGSPKCVDVCVTGAIQFLDRSQGRQGLVS